MINGLIKSTKFDLSVGINLPSLNRYKLNYRLKTFKIKINRFIQSNIKSDFVFKSMSDLDYCHNCQYVFGNSKNPKDMKKSINGVAYCINCPDHRNLGPIRAFTINFRTFKGKYTYTEGEYKYQQDYAAKNAKDLLQPTKYNNVTRKIETNPDFVKTYGDPFKNTDIGSAVEAEFESGDAEFIEGEIDPEEFTTTLDKRDKK